MNGRQVMSPIDLRSQAERQGITRTQQTAQAIANILKTVGAAEQKRRERQTLDRITRAMSGGATAIEAISAVSQEPEFGTGITGALQKFGGMFQPSPGGLGKSIQQAIIGQSIQTDPLETKYRKAQIKSTEALIKQREKDLSDEGQRNINIANTLLRTVGFMLNELWYMEEGPERQKHIEKIQETRERAYKMLEKYGATSEKAKVSLQELANIDKELEKAGVKVTQPKKVGTITATYGDVIEQKGTAEKYVVDSYPTPKNKAEFDSTFKHITNPKEKQRYIDKFWRKEFGRHLE